MRYLLHGGEEFFRWIVQTTWQAAVLVGLILVAQWLLRNDNPLQVVAYRESRGQDPRERSQDSRTTGLGDHRNLSSAPLIPFNDPAQFCTCQAGPVIP